MKKVFLYDKTYNKTHIFPNGEIATPQIMIEKFPAIEYFPQLVELLGNTILSVQDFDIMKDFYKIPDNLSQQEALALIEQKINEPLPQPTASSEDVIAGALSVMALNSMPDNPQTI